MLRVLAVLHFFLLGCLMGTIDQRGEYEPLTLLAVLIKILGWCSVWIASENWAFRIAKKVKRLEEITQE